MSKVKVAIVGLGGIGSWLVNHINWLVNRGQIDTSLIEFHGYDDDEVEDKNTRYQCFEPEDIFDSKAAALEIRFLPVSGEHWFFGHEERITNVGKQLGDANLIISAVDNLKFRKALFEFCLDKEIHWFDFRSEGRAIMALTKHPSNNVEKLEMFTAGDQEENGSCQLAADLEKGLVQLGNQIIAQIGAQYLLNWWRDIPNPAQFIRKF